VHPEGKIDAITVPAIIPAYGSPEQLDKCLAHLRNQSVPVEVFIRDNNHDNVYFTAAVNEGIQKYLHHNYPYILILNQDMYLEPTALAEMASFMASHPECGIAAPLQLHAHDPDRVIWGGSFEPFPVGKHRHGILAEFTQDQQVPWCSGSCMLLQKKMIHQIGLLDENFVFIGSDSDYCFTARARGWQVWMVVRARGAHEYGSSKAGSDPTLELLKAKDMLYFAKKWLTGDLYKTLAHDAAACTPAQIEESVRRLERLHDQWAKPADGGHLTPAFPHI
jgi:GT2 family glycosyltransferase